MPQFGMITFATEYSMSPVEVACAIETRGLDAFYLSEHTHIPISKNRSIPEAVTIPRSFPMCTIRSSR
jgi:hypothetical protein